MEIMSFLKTVLYSLYQTFYFFVSQAESLKKHRSNNIRGETSKNKHDVMEFGK